MLARTRPAFAVPSFLVLAALTASAQCGELDQLQPLGPSALTDSFGCNTAVDGDWMLVAGHKCATKGFVEVYRRLPIGWRRTQTLAPGITLEPASWSTLYGLAIDGDWAFVGSPATAISGAVVVFKQSGGNWQNAGTLVPPISLGPAEFGLAIDVEGDRALVSARKAGGNGYVFAYRRSGDVWSHEQTLQGNAVSGPTWFGNGISIDGNRALITALHEDNPGQEGVAYVFEHDGVQWTQQTKFWPTPDGWTWFGRDCKLSGDTALVSSGIGPAYFFERSGATWVQTKTVPSQPFYDYGYAIELEGDLALVSELPTNAGRATTAFTGSAVEIYDRVGTDWLLRKRHGGCWPGVFSRFGASIAMDARTVVITDTSAQPAGSSWRGVATVFDSPDGQPALACPLYACSAKLSVAQGSTQLYLGNAGLAQAGRIALLLASLAGTSPGIAVDGWTLPLNPDSLFAFTLANPNTAPFSQTLVVLPSGAMFDPKLAIPPHSVPELVGSTLSSAYAVIDPGSLTVTLTSNAVDALIVN